MIASVLATLILAILAMMPGMVLLRGRSILLAEVSAAATASLVVLMLVTALIGETVYLAGFGHLPAFAFGIVSLIAITATLWQTRALGGWKIAADWRGPLLAIIYVIVGLVSLNFAMKFTADGGLLIHGWYNADWFKHLGHVHAIADYGFPARDIFGNGELLHYYWLSYVLPGAGTAIGGDAWAALATCNVIVIALFCMNFYGVVCLTRCPKWVAFTAVLLALIITAPPNFFTKMFSGGGLGAMAPMTVVPKGPALLAVTQVIPQHTLAAAVFLSWALLQQPQSATSRGVKLGSLVACATLLTVSTLLGAMLLGSYGLVQLWRRRISAIPELSGMVLFSGSLVLFLGVLLQGNPGSAIESPLFHNTTSNPWYGRALLAILELVYFTGYPLLVAVVMIPRWKPQDEAEKYARDLSIGLIVSALLCVVACNLFAPVRVASEMSTRAVIPTGIAVPIIGAWIFNYLQERRPLERVSGAAVLLALTIVALPCAYVRMAWMTNLHDSFTIFIPPDDRHVLSELRQRSKPTDRVWQYPEAPVLSAEHGADVWAAVLAGRTVPNSIRATNYAKAEPYVALSRRYFAGQDLPVPQPMKWVYLSRALHPDSYDMLVERLRSNPVWRERACYKDACLFSRVNSGTT